MNIIKGGVTAAKGFKAAGCEAQIKYKNGKKDMALVYSEKPCVTAGTFTTNKVFAAPVKWDRNIVYNEDFAQAVVVNSGVANACTGVEGDNACAEEAKAVAKVLDVPENAVLIGSTGVIGMQLPVDRICAGIEKLAPMLDDSLEAGTQAAEAIMTTDTRSKQVAVEVEVAGTKVTIGGMCKGAGMIHPNMATMLCYITTDCDIDKALLQKMTSDIVEDSFNMISVDGDTSTNDMACVIANGLAGNKKISEENEDYNKFKMALQEVNEALAKKIAEDGEGATKFLEVEVLGAKSKEDARLISKSVITSNLTKCAFFGADANWGRILCAMGYSGGFFEVDKVKIELQAKGMNLVVAEAGRGIGFDEEYAKQLLLHKFLKVVITLEDGNFTAKAWGCDLSYDYVKINGDYRS
jgi:glutamate N-acetyltransferase/amino-acid N-acetyltransferase